MVNDESNDSGSKESSSKEKIYGVLNMIPAGSVASYGQVAKLAGLPGAARLVGTVLRQLPHDTTLPWHRVLKSNGQIAFPVGTTQFNRQKTLLQDENIEVSLGEAKGKVRLAQFGWNP